MPVVTGSGASRSGWRRVAAGVVALSLTLASAACSSDDGGSGTTEAGDRDPAGSPDTAAELSSYADITALHQKLVDQGIECGLEYSGLRDEGREVSICVIEGEQALLTVWDDPALVTEFAASEAAESGDVAYGDNWTVDVDSAETASRVADALGGTESG